MYENSIDQVKCPIHSEKNIQMFCLNSTCSNKRLMCVSCIQNHKQHHICNFNLAKAAINEQETIFTTHTNAFNNRMGKIQFKLKEIGDNFKKCIGTLCRIDIINKIKEILKEEQNFSQLERLTELVGSNFQMRNEKLELISKSENLNKVTYKLKLLTEKFQNITTALSDKNSIQSIQIQSHSKLESLLEPLNLEFNKRLSIVFECKNSCNLVGFHQPILRMTRKQDNNISLKYQLHRNELLIHSEIIVLNKLVDNLNYEIKFEEPILLIPNNIYEISLQSVEGNIRLSYYEQVVQESNYFLQLIDVQGGQFPVLLIMDA